jgi:hypothetical protein
VERVTKKPATAWLYQHFQEYGYKKFKYCLSTRHPTWEKCADRWRWYDRAELTFWSFQHAILHGIVAKEELPTEMTDLFKINLRAGKVIEKWEWTP